MTNEHLYLAIGVPIVVNGLMFLALNWRISDMHRRLDDIKESFDKRFDDLRWTPKLRRSEY